MPGIVPSNIEPILPAQVEDADVRDKLIELLGLSKIPDRVEYATYTVEEADGLRTTSLSYSNSLNEMVPGILMEPLNNPQNRPGIVCIPGTGGSAERVSDPNFHQSPDGPLIGWGRELARRGFTTLAISAKGTEGRRKNIDEWALEQKHLAPYGRTQMGVLVEETLRAARVLCAIDGVDPERIGLTGMSLGGNATWYAAACAPWIAAAVPVCGGVGSLAQVVHHGDPERHSAYYYIPGMLRYFDHPRVVATCVTPRPFLMISPTEDEDMPRAGVNELIPVVAKAYEVTGYTGRFKVHQPEGNHRFLVEYFEWMAAWFQQFLLD